MPIQNKIFEEFFKKLGLDEEFPSSVSNELKKLWKSGEFLSKEKIFKIIKKRCENGNKD